MPTSAELIAAAHALVPTIEAEARCAELARRPSDAVIEQARSAGLFSMMSPRCYGGSELDLDTFFEVGVILAEADASHAWVTCFYIEHVWMLTQFPECFQRALFADRNHVLAPAALAPSGRTETVEGGYRLSGRFPWGTGIVHAEWVIGGAVVSVGERPAAKFLALPADEVTLEDTWHVDGMCATGSHDMLIEDRFVPAERTVDIAAMLNGTAEGARLHDGPLYRTPMAPILSLAASLPVLGAARGAVRRFAEQLDSRVEPFTRTPQSTRVDRQQLLGRADLEVRTAEALMRRVLAEVMDRRATADQATRVGWTASLTHAVGICRQAVDALGEAAGASAHRLDNPIQRIRRDVNTMACHTVFDLGEHHRSHGAALLGLDPRSRWH